MDQMQQQMVEFEIVPVSCNQGQHSEELIIALCLSLQCNKPSALCFYCSMDSHQNCQGSIKMLKDISPLVLPYLQVLSKLEDYSRNKLSIETQKIIGQITDALIPFTQYQQNQGLQNLNQIGTLLKLQIYDYIVKQLERVEDEIQSKQQINKYKTTPIPIAIDYQFLEFGTLGLCKINLADKALALIESYLEKNNNNYNNMILFQFKGYILNKLKRFQEAIFWSDQAIIIDPNSISAWKNKGESLHQLQRFEESIYCFDRAIKIDPTDGNTWLNKGFLLNQLQRHQEASDCLDQSINLDPNDVDVWKYKGQSLNQLKRYQEAIDCQEKAIKINPNCEEAWLLKGLSLNQLQKYREAIDCSDRIIKINPNNIDSWNLKGQSLQQLQRYQEAIDCFDRAINIDPNDVKAFLNKGSLLNQLQLHQEASGCVNQAMKIDSLDEQTQKTLGILKGLSKK